MSRGYTTMRGYYAAAERRLPTVCARHGDYRHDLTVDGSCAACVRTLDNTAAST
ncbi:hypothetical protein SEA_LARS_52 [Mycobacterium phage Lars]|nr:hypothetical protein J3996_gp51 [Mycobacterium phage Laurie]ANZ52345.1 hypothetical protein SEA_LAURIE_51 [Mycobacterium phage Laurie]QWY80974.1 hypothetical protein SEA_LARS_52 [Mycobacterium phage Lars]